MAPVVPFSVPSPPTTVMLGRIEPGDCLMNASPPAPPKPTAGSVITWPTGRNP
jgi:hypothetical protein